MTRYGVGCFGAYSGFYQLFPLCGEIFCVENGSPSFGLCLLRWSSACWSHLAPGFFSARPPPRSFQLYPSRKSQTEPRIAAVTMCQLAVVFGGRFALVRREILDTAR